MKLLFAGLGIYSSHGGEQRYDQTVVAALADLRGRGVRPTVFALWDGPENAVRAPAGTRFETFRRRKWLMLARFAAHLIADRPDVVVYSHVLLTPLAVLTRILRPRAKRVLLVYGLEVWDPPGRLRRAAVARGFDRLISVSRFTAETMARSYRLSPAVFRILHPAVDDPPENGERTGHRSHRLLSVARLASDAHYKGIDVLLDALPRVLERHPETVLEVIGGGALCHELEERASLAGVSGAVIFRGAVASEELDRAYRSADVFVLPSTREGFGIVFLEAWRHAVPVLGADAGASADVLRQGELGVLVPPGDARALAEAIVGLFDAPERARSLGEAGLATVQRYNLHATFRDTLAEILDELTPGPAAVHTRVPVRETSA